MTRKLFTSSLWPIFAHKPARPKIYTNNVIYFADTNIRDGGIIYKFGLTTDISASIKNLNLLVKSECRIKKVIDISQLDEKNTLLMKMSMRKYFYTLRILYPVAEIEDTIRIRSPEELSEIDKIITFGIEHCNYDYI